MAHRGRHLAPTIRRLSRTWVIPLTLVMTLVLGGVAWGDNVQNDVTAGGNDTFILGASTTVNYRIASNNGDDQTGCNAADTTAATVTVNTPAGVAATPGSIMFTSCGTDQSVVFTATAAGDYDITVTVTDGGIGTYNTNPAKFTLHVLAPPPPSDSTPPVITPNVSGTLGNNGWYVGDVMVSWSVVDNESTILSTDGCDSTTIDSDTVGETLTCTATSAGGTASESVTIKRDATAPTVSLVGGPADGGEYYFGSVPAAPTCSASDLPSGLVGDCNVSGYSDLVGTHTVSASATDNAGNVGSDSRTYTVLAWTPSGFYSPVDMNGTVNTIKGGQTVPLKFELFAGPTELKSTSNISYFNTKELSCAYLIGIAEDGIEITTTGATSLRFDATGDQFIQNWQTAKTTNKCYAATVGFQDGSSITGYFKTK